MKQLKGRPRSRFLERFFHTPRNRRRVNQLQRSRTRFETLEGRLLLASDLASDPDELADLLDDTTPAIVTTAEGEGGAVQHAEGEAAPDLVAFAQALADSGTIFYGAAWCPHCTAQKELFEDGQDFLPYVEVTNLDNPVTLNSVGTAENITQFPTWEFPDGSRLTGQQTLETLSQRSGVPITSSDQPFIAPIDDGDLNPNDVDADGDDIVTLLGGSPLHIPLDGYDPGGGPLTYTVSSSNPNLVAPTLLQGNRSMLIDVAGWGKMNFQLFEQRAPRPTGRLIDLATSDFYDGITFHRIVNGFVIQGGDPTGTGSGGSNLGDFDDQFHEELQHNRTGVLSYAKSLDDTNDSQFFVMEGNNTARHLDGNHSVAGILVEGEPNREAISNNSTTNPRDVIMNSVEIFTDNENAVVMLAAAEGASGTAEITVTATDADNNTFTRVFTVNVQPDTSNTLPWLDELNDLTVPSGQTTTTQIQAIDVEGNPITFGVVAPTNFTITVPSGPITPQSPAVANINITPNAGFVGQEEVTFFVYDPAVTSFGNDVTLNEVLSSSSVVDTQMILVEAEDSGITVSGLAFNDLNRDGDLDPGEGGLSGFVIYSDMDNDGVRDVGEPFATTGNDGTYTLSLTAGQHVIREEQPNGFIQTAPTNPTSYSVDLAAGGSQTDLDFGNFEVTAPTSVDLLTDSGTDGDNITNFNNSSSATAPQFQVNGVIEGSQVNLFINGILVEQAIADGSGSVVITLSGTDTLADGDYTVSATQTVEIESAPTSLDITIDTVPPANFTSTPPGTAIVGQQYDYDVQHPLEGQGITYALDSAPSGVAIDSSTGEVTWTPTEGQTGLQTFNVVATDVANNAQTQLVTVNVSKTPRVVIRYDIVDANFNPVSEVSVGETFFLQAFVQDVGANPGGPFAAYQDVTFDGNLANALSIQHGSDFGDGSSGDFSTPGLLDEIGSFGVNATGPQEFFLYRVEFQATQSGSLVFVGSAPDDLPSNNILVHGANDPIPLDEVFYGEAALTITPGIGATDDIFNFDEDTSNNTLDVLANDTTQSGSVDDLTITEVTPVPGDTSITGIVTIASDGKSLLYTPPADFFGEATFNYSVSDGTDTQTANVVVQVFPVNDDPQAVDDDVIVSEDTQTFLSVLSNDTFAPDTDEQLTVVSLGNTSAGGSISIASGGTGVLYTSPSNFSGNDTFTYTISDGNGGTSTATVTVSVTEGNDPPTAGDDSFTVTEDSQDNVFDTVLDNDSTLPDEDETLTISSLGTPSNGGTASISNDSMSISYTPAPDFFGTETLTYTISDGNGGFDTGTITVTVEGTNDPPTAVNDELTVAENSTDNILDVLANDTFAPDADETLTITAVTQGSQGGSVSIGSNGENVTYTPPTDFTGTDTFTYTIDDGTGETVTATVTVNVADFTPGSLSGFVYVDEDNDGVFDAGETPLEDVTITLTGTDDFGGTVSRQLVTNSSGAYSFTNLAPGSYVISETQPQGEVDGVPIFDGQDTVGSQGGTVSANDQLSVTLAEGVDGTGNNFGELLGQSLVGIVQSSNADAFGGIEFNFFQLDESNTRVGSPFQTVMSTARGFEANGLPAGAYEIVPTNASFLIPIGENGLNSQVAQITNDAAAEVEVNLRGLMAKYITPRHFSTLSVQDTVYIAAQPGVAPQQWFSFSGGWTQFTDGEFQLSADGSTLSIQVTQSNGQVLGTSIAVSDPRVTQHAVDNGVHLLQLRGGSDQFNLQVVSNANSEGEGEAPIAAAATAQDAPTNEDTSDNRTDAEGESAPATPPLTPVAASPAPPSPMPAQAEGEGSPTQVVQQEAPSTPAPSPPLFTDLNDVTFVPTVEEDSLLDDEDEDDVEQAGRQADVVAELFNQVGDDVERELFDEDPLPISSEASEEEELLALDTVLGEEDLLETV